jgi:hypothetical protein
MDTLDSNMEKACTVIIGQCTSHLQSKLEALPSWLTIKKTHDPMSLLKELLKPTHRYDEENENHQIAYHTLLTRFYAFRQNELPLDEFYKQFIAWTEVIDG